MMHGMDLGGRAAMTRLLVAAGSDPNDPASKRPGRSLVGAVLSVGLLVDSVVLGGLAGLSAIAGFGWEFVKSHPGAVGFTFLFAFLLQALRYLAQARGLERRP